jgi:hypothetical protein
MRRHDCFRKGCYRIRSQFSAFLNRRRPPQFEGHSFCSEKCLRLHIKEEFEQRWRQMQRDSKQRFPRPRIGTILMQTADITRAQLDQAIHMQQARGEGKIGEWLCRLGFINEHQVTVALGRQFGLPLIDLKNSEVRNSAAQMIPRHVALTANLLPVSYDNDQDSLRIAVSGPVNFSVQQAIGRMTGKKIATYIGDHSAIQFRLSNLYASDERAQALTPGFSSLDDLMEILKNIISDAIARKALNCQIELLESYLWARLDFTSLFEHYFYQYMPVAVGDESFPPMAQPGYAMA